MRLSVLVSTDVNTQTSLCTSVLLRYCWVSEQASNMKGKRELMEAAPRVAASSCLANPQHF